MKSTAFFFVLFALCLVACTKVSQVRPITDSVSKNTVAKSASNTNNGGGVFNPMSCNLPAPSYVWVTSPYTNTANGLQPLKIQWAQVSQAANYRITVKDMTTNLNVLDVSPLISSLIVAPNNGLVFNSASIFTPFTTYQVTVSTKCSDGSIGGNTTVQIIITGGPLIAVQDDLERPILAGTTPYEDYMKSLGSQVTNSSFIQLQTCAANTSFTSGIYTETITRTQNNLPIYVPIKYANIVGTGVTSNSDIVKLKLYVPNAQIGNFLAISEINSNTILPNLGLTNWKIAQFLSAGSIVVILDKSKTYRIRLYNSNMLPFYTIPAGTENIINLDCSILN